MSLGWLEECLSCQNSREAFWTLQKLRDCSRQTGPAEEEVVDLSQQCQRPMKRRLVV